MAKSCWNTKIDSEFRRAMSCFDRVTTIRPASISSAVTGPRFCRVITPWKSSETEDTETGRRLVRSDSCQMSTRSENGTSAVSRRAACP